MGAALCASFLVAPALVAPALVAPALAAPARAQSDQEALRAASICYGAGDMACVIARLEGARGAQPERWRLLAFAAARMDRHDLARQAFATWLGLDARHRLSRETTPPAIWRDYTAALLQVHGAALDLKPRAGPPAVLPPEAVTAVALPRYPLPPREARDRATDFSGSLGLTAGLALPGASPAFGAALDMGLHVGPRWRAGLFLAGLQLPRWAPDPAGLLVCGGLQPAVRLGDGGWGELVALMDVGAGQKALVDGRSSAAAVIRPALRYAWPARSARAELGGFVDLGHRMLLDAEGLRHMPAVSVGLVVRPGARRLKVPTRGIPPGGG